MSAELQQPIAVPPAQLVRTAKGMIELVDEGAGPALLALHGGMGGYDQSWLLANAIFPNETMRKISISRPGYLGTPQKLGTSPEEQADAYAALLNELEIESAVVAAVSAGGPSALEFAKRYPKRCKALILVSTATGSMEAPHGIISKLRAASLFAMIPGVSGFFRRSVLNDPFQAALRGVGDSDTARRTLNHPEAGPMLLALQSGLFARLDERLPGTINDTEMLPRLNAFPFADLRLPILILHGTADDIVPISHGRAVAAQSTRAKALWLSGAGHLALFSHMDEIRIAVGDFLAGLNPR